MTHPALRPNAARLTVSLLAALAAFAFSGCVTAPPTHKASTDAGAKLASLGPIVLAPPDVVVSELGAGGMLEVRDEWGVKVKQNLVTALSANRKIKPAGDLSAEARAELDEVTALLRIIAASRLAALFDAPQLQQAWNTKPLNFNLGRIDRILESTGGEAVVLLFVRDSYATAGRKSLAVLGVLAGAVTGVVILPPMGSTQMCAAVVERDGDVLWFNTLAAGSGDLREAPGANLAAAKLLTGWPGR